MRYDIKTKKIIWGCAKSEWKKRGEPRSLYFIHQMRQELMDILEKEYGINRSTASVQLGKWQKMLSKREELY